MDASVIVIDGLTTTGRKEGKEVEMDE